MPAIKFKHVIVMVYGICWYGSHVRSGLQLLLQQGAVVGLCQVWVTPPYSGHDSSFVCKCWQFIFIYLLYHADPTQLNLPSPPYALPVMCIWSSAYRKPYKYRKAKQVQCKATQTIQAHANIVDLELGEDNFNGLRYINTVPTFPLTIHAARSRCNKKDNMVVESDPVLQWA